MEKESYRVHDLKEAEQVLSEFESRFHNPELRGLINRAKGAHDEAISGRIGPAAGFYFRDILVLMNALNKHAAKLTSR